MTVKELVLDTAKKFNDAELESAEFDARQLTAHFLGTEVSRLLFIKNESVPESVVNKLSEAVEKRLAGRPLQYIIGSWDFYGLPFFVGDGVLIPRQDTELIVDLALDFIRKNDMKTVIDLCSGSGCISVAIGKNAPDVQITAIEKFDTAFGFTVQNIGHNDAYNVKALQRDLMDGPWGLTADLIVTNPPYIRSGDISALSKEVRNEPVTALDGGKDGLNFYREIARLWVPAINPGGGILAEVGFDQAADVAEIFEDCGLKEVTVSLDLNGIPRVVSAVNK